MSHFPPFFGYHLTMNNNPSTTVKGVAIALLGATLLISSLVEARPPTQVKSAVNRTENPEGFGESMILPFAFSSESTEFVVGVGGMRKGFVQKQMSIGGAAFVGEESYGGFGGVWDYRIPFLRRAFVSGMGMLGYYPQHRAYTAPRKTFIPPGDLRPGANDSSEDIFLEAKGDSNWLDVKLDYVWAAGAASEQGLVRYDLAGGLLVSEPSGGEQWNPRESGVTVTTLRQYNRYQSYEDDDVGTLDGYVHGFELGLLYDNTDFPINPSRGSSQYIAIHHDPGWADDTQEWSFIEAEASKYFSFGPGKWSSQRIVALNAWTGYSPSWDVEFNDEGDRRVIDGAPFMEGATLGGFNRMRGYRDSRFHDKASIYASAEYRYTLLHNPIENVEWLRFLNLDWFQVVGFVEGGRVAPEYKADVLFEDWKSDVGFSLRALTGGIVVRFDVAVSDEGSNMWVMVGHPF